MKRVVIILVTFLVALVPFSKTAYAVDDGSLKINTGIEKGRDSKEVLYIEQENDLSTLFSTESSKLIKKNQERIKKEDGTNNELFIKKIGQDKVTTSYRSLLFTTNTPDAKSDYEITLNDKSKHFSWKMLLIIGIGVFITFYSLLNKILRKEHSR